MKVEMGIKGTHGNYNVVYNGECIGEYFDSEIRAKLVAIFSDIPNMPKLLPNH